MADAWRGDVQRERQQGRPLDAMKALMLEMLGSCSRARV